MLIPCTRVGVVFVTNAGWAVIASLGPFEISEQSNINVCHTQGPKVIEFINQPYCGLRKATIKNQLKEELRVYDDSFVVVRPALSNLTSIPGFLMLLYPAELHFSQVIALQSNHWIFVPWR
ncbi:hypothetical protein H2248_004348 [Termitomyces sp. 'cryptogamus']|nr:hypothetical protein H2248_004348 [Termitomyces sp. 'cryptogamus']